MRQFYKLCQSIALLMCLTSYVMADDTDIIDLEAPVDSNILFVMDMSGSMAWEVASDTIPVDPANSRKNILHAALKTVLNDPLIANINIGIASFAGDNTVSQYWQRAHGISYPVAPIDGDAATILDTNPLFDHQGISYLPAAGGVTSRGYVGDKVPSTWSPYGSTPIVDALYEAALYFRGEPVVWGKTLPSTIQSAHPSSYTGLVEEVTVTSCPIGDPLRQYCDDTTVPSSCNATKDCSGTTTTTDICTGVDADPSSSCVQDHLALGYVCGAIQNVTTNCGEGVSMCGVATDPSQCWDVPVTVTRVCGLATELACETQPAPNNGWYNCTWTGSVEAGNRRIECKEDITVTNCPQKRIQCTKQIPSCTHCPATTLTGSPVYKSPIQNECSNNAIVLLSDGTPTNNNSAAYVSNLIGASYSNSCSSGSDNGRCGKELTKFLVSEDQNLSLSGEQTVKTHTIGLALNDPNAIGYLQELATNGGGLSVMANTPSGLVNALHDIITHVSKARSFSSPSYTSSANSLSNGDYVYVPVFDKAAGAVWSGNLKKYKQQNGKLIDANGNDATDAFGTLFDTAKDYWATNPSIHAVTSGGAANKLPDPSVRKVLTEPGSSGNLVNIAAIGNSEYGVSSVSEKNTLVDFIKGKNADGSTRYHMGDILHSKPVIVDYGTQKLIFVGTNEGLLHAIKEATGEELFAYMPRILLKNIKPQYTNNAANGHLYGVDGEITLWHKDTNHNQVVDSGESAVLLFGLRRGGKAYYALDVSNPASPSLKWRIKKDTGNFSQLGYTWSKPIITKFGTKNALIFGGGYVDDNGLEPAHAGTPEADNSGTGSDVYIVDADTGAFIWKTPDAAISYAVPGDIRVLDLNRDGSADRLYFADTGGYVWRADFTSKDTSNMTTFSTGAKIFKFADLGAVSAPATTRRKFFVEPDVALFKHGGKYLISVALGSGERPKPLDDTSDDKFFVLFDDKPFASLSTDPDITLSDLLAAPVTPPLSVFSSGKKGWYMDLIKTNGEKVLSRALTYNNKVIFSTFGTTSIVPTACDVSNVNQSRLYVLDLFTGDAVLDLNQDGSVGGSDDRSKKLATGEIPGPPQIIFNDLQSDAGGPCVKDNCIRPEEIGVGKSPATKIPGPYQTIRRAYWIDKE